MKRITFITGHYGSGKSECSANLAIQKKIPFLVDLDIVNPYFRTRELEELFASHQIETVHSSIKKSIGSDLPYIDQKAFLPFYNKEMTAIYDLGGDGVGAILLRQFEEWITEDVDLLLCINIYREETATVEKIIQMKNLIEGKGGIQITGLINNSNFLRDTTEEDILLGQKIVKEVSGMTGLPIVYTSYYQSMTIHPEYYEGELLPLALYLRKKWL